MAAGKKFSRMGSGTLTSFAFKYLIIKYHGSMTFWIKTQMVRSHITSLPTNESHHFQTAIDQTWNQLVSPTIAYLTWTDMNLADLKAAWSQLEDANWLTWRSSICFPLKGTEMGQVMGTKGGVTWNIALRWMILEGGSNTWSNAWWRGLTTLPKFLGRILQSLYSL